MDPLVKIGLGSLALGALSGWLVVLGTDYPERLRRLGVAHPPRVRQAHLDWIMMGLILVAVGAAFPELPGWIAALVVAGAIVNPLLFVPLAFSAEVRANAVYRGITVISFTALSIGLSATFIAALAQ